MAPEPQPPLFSARTTRIIFFGTLAVLLAAVGFLGARSVGESARTKTVVNRAVADLQEEIRSDCAFKWDLADLPREIRPRTRGLVKIAADARFAYMQKGCQDAGGPPPPPLYAADPTPTPSPSR